MMSSLQKIMAKNVMTIAAGASLSEATQLMQERRIRHLPVVRQDGNVIGMLSSKNLPLLSELKNIPVDYFMSTELIYVHQDSTLKFAIQKILENKVSSLLICDSENNVVGIVTTDDLLFHLVQQIDERKTETPKLSELLDLPTISQIAHQISSAGV